MHGFVRCRMEHLSREGGKPVVTLIEFLREQLDEDERLARRAHGGWGPWSWTFDDRHREARSGGIVIYGERDPHGSHTTTGAHIVRHDPARVIADIEAKRRIIDEHHVTVTQQGDTYDVECEICGWASDDPTSACLTVRLLALPYVTYLSIPTTARTGNRDRNAARGRRSTSR